MTTFPFEVPSYVQGYRFDDTDARCYNAASKTFLNLSPYGNAADLVTHTGTPVFGTEDGHRAAKLDNTWHAKAPMPIAWQGSMVIVAKLELLTSGTHTNYVALFGDSASATSSGHLQFQSFGAQRNLILGTAGSALKATTQETTEGIRAAGYATDQSTRKGYSTLDGSTITETTAAASSTDGNAVALEAAENGIRFGEVKGSSGDVTAETDLICWVYEWHFFADNIWTDHLAEAAALMTSLRTKYGVS